MSADERAERYNWGSAQGIEVTPGDGEVLVDFDADDEDQDDEQ